MFKVINLPLGGLLNRHIYQILVKLHVNNPSVGMGVLSSAMAGRHSVDRCTKPTFMWFIKQVIITSV